ncbi:MAG: SprT family zinc-dependent metalloprotease [Verrucomicrobiota bacterium]
MPLDFLFRSAAPVQSTLAIGSRSVPIHFIRNPRARRYILRLRPDGSVRATVPGRGSIKEARAFAERNLDWLRTRLQQPPAPAPVWQLGMPILYRGQTVTLQPGPNTVTFGDQTVTVAPTGNLRLAVERHLWRLAGQELPARTRELAGRHNIPVHRITIRNQRSRWGSCSRHGTISLNWRLIQTPAFVQDYIILHELMHRREMNHSARYWKQVAAVCPDFETAEKWLKQHRALLGSYP